MISVIYVIFIVVAIGVAVAAEVMVAYKKYQMKKQFLEELDEKEGEPEARQKSEP